MPNHWALCSRQEGAHNELSTGDRQAHYHFILQAREQPNFATVDCEHGRIETRKIWTSSALNDYLDFPHVGQVFLIERHALDKRTGESSLDIADGIASRAPTQADAQYILNTNRSHRCIENSCHYIIDWNYDGDRSRIHTGHGPENITRLRRFAVGLLKSKGVYGVAQKMRELTLNIRLVFDYLRMTKRTCVAPPH